MRRTALRRLSEITVYLLLSSICFWANEFDDFKSEQKRYEKYTRI